MGALTLQTDGEELNLTDDTRRRLAIQAASTALVMSLHPDAQRVKKVGVSAFEGEGLLYGEAERSTINQPFLHYARTVASHLVLNMGASPAGVPVGAVEAAEAGPR